VSRVTPANGPFRASVARLPEVVDVLERLDRAGVPVWLDGGWGVDALVGRQTRPHRDLDLGPFAGGSAMARPGLEPGTPRFSGEGTNHSYRRTCACISRLSRRPGASHVSRKLRTDASLIRTRVAARVLIASRSQPRRHRTIGHPRVRLTRRELTGEHHRRRRAQRRSIVPRLLPAAARLIEAKLVITHAGNDGPMTEDRGAGDGSRRSCLGAAVSAESNLLSRAQPYGGMSGNCRTQQGFFRCSQAGSRGHRQTRRAGVFRNRCR
jgi:hypothetical protein